MNIQPAFVAAFFAPFGDIASPRAAQTPVHKPVLFSDDAYRDTSIQQFMASPDFTLCQQEYVAVLDRIVDFAETNADKIVPHLSGETIATIRLDFALLKTHLIDLNDDFFSTHKPIIYGLGKEMFHELDALLHDPKMSFQKRLDAVQAMAPQVRMCSGGLLTVVSDSISSLKHSTAGLKGAAYRAKIRMIDALISQHVSETHHYAPGNEVHFVNAYFNYVANDMGVPARRDAFTSIAESAISIDQLKACRDIILSRLTPNRLSSVMADEYLGRIKSAVTDAKIDINSPVEEDQLTALFNATHDIRKAHLDQEFGQIPETGYLLPVADTYQYRLAKEPTLVARHFIEHLKQAGLVDYAATIRIPTGDTARGDLMQLGDLFWREKDGSCEEISSQELLQISPDQVVQALNDAHVPLPSQDALLQNFARHVPDTIHTGLAQPPHVAWLDTFARIFKQSASADKDWIVPVVFLAAVLNRATTLLALADAGADLNATDSMGRNTLMYAADNGNEQALQALIAGGAALDSTDVHGTTAMMFAANNGQTKAINALIAGGAALDATDANCTTAMVFAAHNGHADALHALIAGGADLDTPDVHGMTAIMFAAENGHTGAVDALITGGANVNAPDSSGKTSVMFAAKNDYSDALDALITGGADINAPDPHGTTAVMFAAINGATNALQALTEGQANLDAADLLGTTAVMFAASSGDRDVLQVLITGGANPDARDSGGMTAVMMASKCGHAAVLQDLIAVGANLDATDSTGKTAMLFAETHGHADVLQVLIAGGAAPSPAGNPENTSR